jgi:hypothetical protein
MGSLGRLAGISLLLVLIACSGDGGDDGGGVAGGVGAQSAEAGVAALCEVIEEQDATMGAFDPTSPDNARAMEEARAVAPPGLVPHLEVLADSLAALAALDIEAPDAAERLEEIVGDPAYLEAGEALAQFMHEDCAMGADDDEASAMAELEAYVDRRYEDEEMNRDLFDGQGIPEGYYDGWVDTRHLGLWLDAHHAEAEWYQQRPSRFANPGNVGIQGELTGEQALEACEALVLYLAEVAIEADITVTDFEGTVLAEDSSGACAAG